MSDSTTSRMGTSQHERNRRLLGRLSWYSKQVRRVAEAVNNTKQASFRLAWIQVALVSLVLTVLVGEDWC